MKNRWRRSALKKANQNVDNDNHLENFMIYDVLHDGEIGRGQGEMLMDNLSEMSYGSHLNRDFDSGSHRGSFVHRAVDDGTVEDRHQTNSCNDSANEEQHGRLSMILMNSGAKLRRDTVEYKKNEIRPVEISIGMYTPDDEKSESSMHKKRSVVIDDQGIDMFSPEPEEEEDVVDAEEEAKARLEADILEATTQELLMKEYPSDCCPESCYLRFPILAGGDPDSPFWQGWGNLRIKTFRLIENKYFETAVIAMILISSGALVSCGRFG